MQPLKSSHRKVFRLFAFPPPDPPQINTSSGMNSDTISDISVFHTVSQFNNSVVETPDEIADSETSSSINTQTKSSIFSKSPFQPIQPHNQFPSPSTPSHISQITPTYSPFNSERSSNNPQTTMKFLKNLIIL